MKLKVKTMAMGMAEAMMRVVRNFRRKKRRTMTARTPPMMPDQVRSFRLLRMSSDWSL